MNRFAALLSFASLFVATNATAEEDQPEPRFGGSGATMLIGSVVLQAGLGSAQMIGLMTLDSTILCDAEMTAPGESFGSCPPSPKLGAPYLFIPLVGPFIAMEKIDAKGGQAGLYAATGVAQFAGLATLLIGVAVRSSEDGAPPPVTAAPIVTPDFYGAGLTAAF
jgi:hypothetical protein